MLFDAPDQPTDPRTIDPGGTPLPPAAPPPQDTAAPTGTDDLDEASAAPSAPDQWVTPSNFPASLHPLVPSGAKARVRANIAALRMLGSLAAAQRAAQPAEQAVLAAWSGWGAVPQVFDPRNTALAPEREVLAELLDRDQYRQAEASILNAHYTDPAIAAVIWEALGQAGFAGGRVLEPAFIRNFDVSRDARTVCHDPIQSVKVSA